MLGCVRLTRQLKCHCLQFSTSAKAHANPQFLLSMKPKSQGFSKMLAKIHDIFLSVTDSKY